MTFQSTTLRPGLLIGLNTAVKGNVSYVKQDLSFLETEGVEKTKWETERTIADVAEFDRASKVRSDARGMIAKVCAQTAFGLLCSDEAKDDLDRAVADANKLVAEFNSTARITKVNFSIITGRIAPDDVAAVKAINAEVRGLVEEMKAGLESLDVKKVRDAASRAKELGGMLSPEAQARIQIAIDAARATAKRMVKAGEQAAVEIDRATLNRLTEVRTAFLDIDQEEREVQAPEAEGRAIDLSPEAEAAADSEALAAEIKAFDLSEEDGPIAAPAPVARAIEVG